MCVFKRFSSFSYDCLNAEFSELLMCMHSFALSYRATEYLCHTCMYALILNHFDN